MAVSHQVKIKDREISSLVLPLQTTPLLLPNEAVAEIVTDQVIPYPKGGGWFLGHVDWRAMQVPVISFERFTGQTVKASKSVSFMAVLNGFQGDARLPFYGLVIAGLPSLERVLAGELVVEEVTLKEAERFQVIISGTHAVIPNLAFLESAIIQALQEAK